MSDQEESSLYLPMIDGGLCCVCCEMRLRDEDGREFDGGVLDVDVG